MLSKPAAKETVPDALRWRDSALPLMGLLAVAALLRAYAWSQTAVLFNDGPVFLALAEAIGEGRWAEVLAHPYHPLYPICIALVSATGLSSEISAVIVSIFGGLLGILSLYTMLVRAWGRDIAWIGAWILTLHPWAIDFSSDVMSDGLYMGLYLAAFAFLAELVDRPNWRVAAACGGFSALAFLTRPEGLGLVPIAGLLIGARALMVASFPSPARLSLLALFLAAGIIVGPYVATLSIEAGEWTWTQKKTIGALAQGEPFVAGVPERFRDGARNDVPLWFPQSASHPGAGRPTRDLVGVAETLSRVIRTSAAAIRYEVLVFVLVGFLVLHAHRPRRGYLAAVGLSILAYSVLLMLLVWGAGYVSRRHALAVWIPLIGVAAVGWRALATSVLQRWMRWRRADSHFDIVSPRAICLGLVIVLAIVWGPRDLRERRADRAALRAAAEWVAQTHPDSGPIAAEKLRVAYYGRAAFVPLPAYPGSGLQAGLRASRTRWVVVDADRIDRIPELSEAIDSWMLPVYVADSHDRRALVFEIH